MSEIPRTAQGNGLSQGDSPARGESHAFLLNPLVSGGKQWKGEAKEGGNGSKPLRPISLTVRQSEACATHRLVESDKPS